MSLFETMGIESCRSRRPQLRHLMSASLTAAFYYIKFPPWGFFFSFRSTLLLLFFFCSSPLCPAPICSSPVALPFPLLLCSAPTLLLSPIWFPLFCILFLLIYLLDAFSIIFFLLIFPCLLCSLGLIHYHRPPYA